MKQNVRDRGLESMGMKRCHLLLAALTLCLIIFGCDEEPSTPTAPVQPIDRLSPQPKENARPPRWATPIEVPGVPNCFKVSEQLYRGGQPTAEGVKELKKLGITTIVNLRKVHSDRDEIGDTPIRYEHITMTPWHPEEKEVVRFLKIVTNPQMTPVFVHCEYGSDRTGMMVALYRIAFQDWTKEEAIREMTEGGFGYHGIWQNLLDYIQDLDIEKLKAKAGLNK